MKISTTNCHQPLSSKANKNVKKMFMPQANNIFIFQNLINYAISDPKDKNRKYIKKSTLNGLLPNKRALHYYLSAAINTIKLVSIVNGEVYLTDNGLQMYNKSKSDFSKQMHEHLVSCDVFYKTLTSNVPSCENEIKKLLKNIDLSEGTKKRRLSTYISWKKTLTPYLTVKAPRSKTSSNENHLQSATDVIAQDSCTSTNVSKALYVKKSKIRANKFINKNQVLYRFSIMKQRSTNVQEFFRNALLVAHKDTCIITGVTLSALLFASHIKPYSKCTSEEALDIDNGLLLETRFDRLFDQGYISFCDNGFMLLSEHLDENNRQSCGLKSDIQILKNISDKKKKFLKYHRDEIFKK